MALNVQTPAEFLKAIKGKPVLVKLNSGVDYRGESNCSLQAHRNRWPCGRVGIAVDNGPAKRPCSGLLLLGAGRSTSRGGKRRPLGGVDEGWSGSDSTVLWHDSCRDLAGEKGRAVAWRGGRRRYTVPPLSLALYEQPICHGSAS